MYTLNVCPHHISRALVLGTWLQSREYGRQAGLLLAGSFWSSRGPQFGEGWERGTDKVN